MHGEGLCCALFARPSFVRGILATQHSHSTLVWRNHTYLGAKRVWAKRVWQLNQLVRNEPTQSKADGSALVLSENSALLMASVLDSDSSEPGNSKAEVGVQVSLPCCSCKAEYFGYTCLHVQYIYHMYRIISIMS